MFRGMRAPIRRAVMGRADAEPRRALHPRAMLARAEAVFLSAPESCMIRPGLATPQAMDVHVVRHPLVENVLAALRDRRTPSDIFRQLAHRVSLLLVAEATRDLPLAETTIETPLETTTVRRLAARVVAVPVLRAGLGMLDALLELVPQAQVGYFGLERDERTAAARRYYEKVPKDLADASVFLLDPMLATGGSATMAIEGLAELGARRVRLLSIVAAPEGLAHLKATVPDATVYTTAVDRELNARKFILPGLGDFGDRLFGT
jgi:uracil phosphoribosyltransferase